MSTTPNTDSLMRLWEEYLATDRVGNAEVTEAINRIRQLEIELNATRESKNIVLDRLDDAIAAQASAAPTPGDTEIVDWLENISSTAYPVKIGKTLSGQPWVVCESGHYPGSDLRDCLRAALQRPARDGGVTPFRAYVADPDNQTNEYAERVKRANPSTPKEQP